jgi:hypothetical protein
MKRNNLVIPKKLFTRLEQHDAEPPSEDRYKQARDEHSLRNYATRVCGLKGNIAASRGACNQYQVSIRWHSLSEVVSAIIGWRLVTIGEGGTGYLERSGCPIEGFAGRLRTIQLKMCSVLAAAGANQISIERIDLGTHSGPGKAA